MPQILHLPTTAFLGKKHSSVYWNYPTDALYLTLTASTKRKKQNAVCFRLDDFAQARSQLSILSIRQIRTLKHTVLHPLPVGFENFVNLSPPLVFRDIVRNQDVHDYFKTKGGYWSISPIRYFANSRA
jgi:hypothetical protein